MMNDAKTLARFCGPLCRSLGVDGVNGVNGVDGVNGVNWVNGVMW